MTAPRTVILIGAARSGTKVMRDALGVALGAGVVPYDVGYVWRFGNESVAHDALEPEMVRRRTRRMVAKFLDRYRGAGIVIEKSVGNCLRIPYVHEIVPDAVFINLVRDGVDVVESAARQWQAPTDWRYLAAKARHFPLQLAPSYGTKYVANATWKRGTTKHLPTWGPRYPGIDRDLREAGLLTVCARQWRECVTRAHLGFAAIDAPVANVRFEELVATPEVVLSNAIAHLGLTLDAGRVREAAQRIRPDSVGHGRRSLGGEFSDLLNEEIGITLEEFGYDHARG